MLNRIALLIVLLCIGAAFINPLFAQDTTKSVKWDLQTCLDYAKKNNVQLNILKYSQKTAEQEYLLSKAAVLPNLYGSATQNIGHSNTLIVTNIGSVGTITLPALRQADFINLQSPLPEVTALVHRGHFTRAAI